MSTSHTASASVHPGNECGCWTCCRDFPDACGNSAASQRPAVGTAAGTVNAIGATLRRATGAAQQLAAAQNSAKEALADYERKAPQFLASFTAVQRELIADWMAATFLEGVKYSLNRLTETLSDEHGLTSENNNV